MRQTSDSGDVKSRRGSKRALVVVEQERACDRVEHLRRRVDLAALLEPRVPRDSDARDLRDLLAPEARCAPPPRGAEAYLLGRYALAPAAKERAELLPPEAVDLGVGKLEDGRHVFSMRHRSSSIRVALIPG